jgi:hypothetical protein
MAQKPNLGLGLVTVLKCLVHIPGRISLSLLHRSQVETGDLCNERGIFVLSMGFYPTTAAIKRPQT